MNSQTKKGTASGNIKQQKNKCNTQCDNESSNGLGFDVYDILSFADKSEARAYLENNFNFDAFADEDEFLEHLKGYAKQGDLTMKNLLGFCYYVGYGCEESPKKAIQWWTKAAEQGDVCSQRCIGGCYYNGNMGVRKNYTKVSIGLRKPLFKMIPNRN